MALPGTHPGSSSKSRSMTKSRSPGHSHPSQDPDDYLQKAHYITSVSPMVLEHKSSKDIDNGREHGHIRIRQTANAVVKHHTEEIHDPLTVEGNKIGSELQLQSQEEQLGKRVGRTSRDDKLEADFKAR